MVSACKHFSSTITVEETEAAATLYGLQIALSLGLQDIEAEIDSAAD